MRPLRIELEGFSAYRQLESVTFEDVDFFSLTGPTGSGKSSLIDAMIFALYGRVPRLGGNAVAPAITAGADRARVRFDFEVDGDTYTAVRMAQRTSSGGATVKEARLQRGDEVLADGADLVTAAVEDLLRLRFDDFTRTVVLPQGDFSRFLTATKAERQGLLRNLLGLDVYTTVRELAKTREAVAADRADSAERALAALEVPDEEVASAAKERLGLLEKLAGSIGDDEKDLAKLDSAVDTVREDHKRVGDAIDKLRAIEVPSNLEAHETLMVEARSALVDADEALVAAKDTLTSAEVAISELPGSEQIKGWRKGRSELETVDKRLEHSALFEAREAVQAAGLLVQTAENALGEARTATSQARSDHAAHLLAGSLVKGEPCPVCAQNVISLPAKTKAPGLVKLEKAERARETAVKDARKEEQEAVTRLATAESSVTELENRRTQLLADLEGTPEAKELDELDARLTAAVEALATAKTDLAERTDEQKKAADLLADLADSSRQMSRQLTTAQLSVAALDPPLSESDDPLVQWKELSLWRDETVQIQISKHDEIASRVEDAEKAAATRREELIEKLRAGGLQGVEPFAVEVATSLQEARRMVETHVKTVAEAAELGRQSEESRTSAVVAGALANHLKATGFERWLMAGALTDLVVGANQLLGDLSGGGYSLHADDAGDFSIVDHRNADEKRSVSTLSGGETFLVSLALALSLAETLAAKGGSGLDAIILDEGFGTLDEESLDTVASVLEELSGKGLMVGVITHVKELAMRAPVRYEVRRGVSGARIEVAS